MNKNEELTQKYSTFGDKLLQHADVLHAIQKEKKFKPITVQVALTEACDLSCSYCSVKNRNKSDSIPFDVVKLGLRKFKKLGAKALEITGGGNPLLYPRINDVISEAYKLGYDIGVITNSTTPSQYLTYKSIANIAWIRVSMSALDVQPNNSFYLGNIPKEKLGLSYIINEKTTEEIITQIAGIATMYDVKFVRVAPDCLGDYSLNIKEDWSVILDKYNNTGKIFLKEINDNYFPFERGCYVGLIRPYWTASGVYICSSHVLKTRKYEPEFKLCNIEDVTEFWSSCSKKYAKENLPYEIDTNNCYHCYYFNNNKLLHTVATEMPDRNFA